MFGYIVRRLLLAVPTLVALSILVFGLMHMIPGDAVLARLEEVGVVTDESIDAVRRELGLDKPFVGQLGTWLWDAARGDFGSSLWTSEPTILRLRQAIPVSAELAILGVLLAVVIAVPLGVVSAIYQDSAIDYVARLFTILGISMPDFWIGTMLLVYLALYFGFLPPIGYVSIWEDPLRNLEQFMLPASVLGLRLCAATARMVRATMLDVLRRDYVRTARAKGLSERVVIYVHALRNSLIPVVTILGGQLAYLFGGAIILETMFTLPGVGFLTYSSIMKRDYTQVQTDVLFFGGVMILMNLLVDLSYAFLDPRVRYK